MPHRQLAHSKCSVGASNNKEYRTNCLATEFLKFLWDIQMEMFNYTLEFERSGLQRIEVIYVGRWYKSSGHL